MATARLKTLAMQFSHLIRTPARAGAPIAPTLAAYRELMEDLIATDTPVSPGTANVVSLRAQANNNFRSLDLLLANCILAVVEAATRAEYTTRPEAIAAAEEVRALYELYTDWREAKIEEISLTDPGASYQLVQRAVAQVTAYLVDISFSLKQEHRIVLDRARTPLDICAEFYGEVDPMLDFFIESNDLAGTEIVEIPKGRTIVLYL